VWSTGFSATVRYGYPNEKLQLLIKELSLIPIEGQHPSWN
jgi:hypothetical protein